MTDERTIKVAPETAEAISAIARKSGLPEAEIIDKLMKLQLQDKPRDPMRDKLQKMRESISGGGGGGETKSPVDKYLDLMGINTIKSAFGQQQGGNNESKPILSRDMLAGIVEMKIAMSAIGPLLGQSQQPQQQGMGIKEMVELITLMKSPDGPDKVEKIMEHQRHQDELRRKDDDKRQQDMMNMMKEAITGKRMDEIEARAEQREDSINVDKQRQLEYLQSMETRLAAGQQSGGGFSDELQKYSTIRGALIDFAKEEGMTKEVVDESSGKIKWEKVIPEGIKAIQEVVSARTQQPPQPQEVIEMTPEEYAAYQQQAAQPTPQVEQVQSEIQPVIQAEPQEAAPVEETPAKTEEIIFSPTGESVKKPKKSKVKKKK